MNQDIKYRWIEALRSGRYAQGRRMLNRNNEFCCLGVLCEIAVEDGIVTREVDVDGVISYTHGVFPSQRFLTSLLSSHVADWAGMDDNNPEIVGPNGEVRSLTGWNDSGVLNFNQIADLIEEKL